MLDLLMNNFLLLLTRLQATIAVVSARERHLTVLLVAVWARLGRMRTRLERLVALWRAGKLPKARKSRAGEVRKSVRVKSIIPRTPAWLLVAVRGAGAVRGQLEALLSEAEYAEFIAAVPQAGRILRPLCQMLGVGEKPPAPGRKPRVGWRVPRAEPMMVAPAGLVVGPGGRLMYV